MNPAARFFGYGSTFFYLLTPVCLVAAIVMMFTSQHKVIAWAAAIVCFLLGMIFKKIMYIIEPKVTSFDDVEITIERRKF